MEEVLKKIKAARKERGLTLESMANELGMSDSNYRKIENNQTRLSLENFLKIAKELDVSVNDLLAIKPKTEYHQNNNEKGTFIGHQELVNYYQDNKEITNRYISSLEERIKYLQEENLFLRQQLPEKNVLSGNG
jgi:transcriptional regulator with XRE-family HTH domain